MVATVERAASMSRSYPERPFVGVGVVILRGEEVLLIRRGKPPRVGHWSLPGGAQELGETVNEAANSINEGVNRLILTTQQDNQGVIDAITPHLTAFYPSQLFQALTDGPILGGILALIWLRPRRPGTIGCFFLIVYGILRISTEFFRQPDVGVALLLGFSRGQVLSFAMIAAGTVILWLIKKRNAAPMGGLLSPVADQAG